MTRMFVAIELDDVIKESMMSLKNLFPQGTMKAKFTNAQNLHITLKFIGERPMNDINDIIEKLNDAKEGFHGFELEIRGIGAFPNNYSPRIIWVGGNDPKVISLADEIDAKLGSIGIQRETRPFSSHITLARVKEVTNKNNVNDIINANRDIFIGKQNVERFYLKKSQLTPEGPIYSDIGVIEL